MNKLDRFEINEIDNQKAVLERHSSSESFGNVPRKVLSDALVNVRQHEIYLKTLLYDIINCAKNVESIQIQLASLLDQLKNSIQSKTAVPTSQVYVLIDLQFETIFK